MENQDEFRKDIKMWLKANGHDYAWLAEHCYVTESTVRNWMARKTIPAAKVYIIRDLVRQVPMSLPPVVVETRSETVVTLRFDDGTRTRLENLAFSRGQTLTELLEAELTALAKRAEKQAPYLESLGYGNFSTRSRA